MMIFLIYIESILRNKDIMRIKKMLIVASFAAILGTSASAFATLGCPDNGLWYYGTGYKDYYDGGDTKCCYSEYNSWDYANYSATAVSSKGSKRVVKSDGNTAKAAVEKSLMGNKAYYNYWN